MMFRWLNSYGVKNVVEYNCTIKTKVFQKRPTHGGIIEAKEFYIQPSFEIYKGKLVLRF